MTPRTRRRTRTTTTTTLLLHSDPLSSPCFLSLLLLLFAGVRPSHCQEGDFYGGGGGEWRLLHSSIGISAMHMQLLPGDSVVMFDRTGSGTSNISLPGGRCLIPLGDASGAVDCTAHSVLLDLPSGALRPLALLSDPWCSSAALLPNGSLLQTGGFGDGDRNVRSFTTGGDWIEHPQYLSARRWYASDQLLPDGRVIIVGGRRQFNYEFFPSSAGGDRRTFPFPFLEDTRDGDAENNLYPFLHLLPDGKLFVFANTDAVLLDFALHRVVRRFPAIPGGAPRSYPSAGGSVLLPLRPVSGEDPAATRAEILVCGGAPRGSYQSALRGTFLTAERTCGRIVATDPDPAWSMELMPLARVMGDMVLLPTGDVLIVNGARSGTAGWELGRDPVRNPLLYKPDSPPGQRFEVLSPSQIPRMYHSAAALDTYGRVLVGGSNPHVGYNFTGVEYPTELSLEAFLPAYFGARLAGGRPVVEAGRAEVGYGEVVRVRFAGRATAGGGMYGVVEVAAVAPAFATHTVAMNQRMVVMEVRGVEAVGAFMFEVEVVGPPTPAVAPPGYYLWFVVQDGVPSLGVWVKIR